MKEKIAEKSKLSTKQETNWNDIFAKWMKSQMYSKTIDGLQDFLDASYRPPKPKNL